MVSIFEVIFQTFTRYIQWTGTKFEVFRKSFVKSTVSNERGQAFQSFSYL